MRRLALLLTALALAPTGAGAEGCQSPGQAAPGQAAPGPGAPGAVSPDAVALQHPSPREVVAGFGRHVHPLLQVEKLHAGLDYSGPLGDPVRAAAAGTVEHASYKGEHGNHVVVRHSATLATTYSHLARIVGAREGDCIAAGHVIGQLGSTGLSSGPHLHFEVLRDGRPIDPATVLPPR